MRQFVREFRGWGPHHTPAAPAAALLISISERIRRPMVTLDGCAGVVTGADGDFGREIALELAREGAHLLLLDDDADALKTLVIAIAADGRRSTSARVDSTDAFTLDSAIRSFEAEHRPFDFLVAATEEIESTGFGEGDPDRWHSLADVNILDALFAVRATLPSLLANGMGHIVLLGSVAGRKACRDAALYCATKRAVTDLGHALRAEGESPGVAATIVEPGASLLSDARSWLSH